MIIEFELPGGQCAPQIVLQRQPFLHRIGHAGLEEESLTAAALLGNGHRNFGVSQQIVAPAAVVGPHAYANARAHPYFQPVNPPRAYESVQDGLRAASRSE